MVHSLDWKCTDRIDFVYKGKFSSSMLRDCCVYRTLLYLFTLFSAAYVILYIFHCMPQLQLFLRCRYKNMEAITNSKSLRVEFVENNLKCCVFCVMQKERSQDSTRSGLIWYTGASQWERSKNSVIRFPCKQEPPDVIVLNNNRFSTQLECHKSRKI